MNEFLERIAKLPPKKLALLAWELQSRVEALERSQREPIAVIGLGCRFPGGAESPQSFWQLLTEGRDAIVEVPRSRWDVDAYYDPDPDAPGKMSTRFGGFLDQVDQFDPHFFGIAPREAQSMDPQQRLLLEVAWEALEHAGHSAEKLHGTRTGVYVGISGHDYYVELLGSGDPAVYDAYLASGSAHSVASGRLSYLLGLHGPSLSVDTACSSSLVALHLACLGLRAGDCRVALAGGVNLVLRPDVTITLSKTRMMAPDGRCKAFDASADGFVRGEGCGIVVLKRLADAQADGDRILAVIRGTAANQDGKSSGLTAPNGRAQEDVIRLALADAGVDADRVGYVETHGTGTSLGDPIEVRALGAVLCEGRPADRPLLIGSVKTNIGHLESAAGIAGLIKLILCVERGEVPPHLHFKDPNPHIPWDELAVRVVAEHTTWPESGSPRVGAVSAFGFSGTNVHVIVEEAPDPVATRSEVERSLHLLTLSARSDVALQTLAERYATHLVTHPEQPWADVCHTATAGRAHLPHRLALVAETAAEAQAALATVVTGETVAGVATGRAPAAGAPPLAFLFTGQGAQYVGMGRELYRTQPVFREALDRGAESLRPHLEHPLLGVMWGEAGPAGCLDQTGYTQPALFALEVALAELWRSWGVTPTWVLGHSVGEVVAAVVAGVLTLEDGGTLIATRAKLMQALPPGGAMLAVRASAAQVAPLLAPYAAEVALAAVNGPASVVISGRRAAVAQVQQALAAAGVSTTPLAVSHAFHSPLMDPMLADFERVAAGLTSRAPQVGLISNLTGRLVQAGELDAAYWRRHVREAVQFQAGMATLQAQGAALFLEVGPAPVLCGLGQACLPAGTGPWLPSLRKGRGDWATLLPSLAALYVRGVPIDWVAFDRPYPRRTVSLPTYPFQRERYWHTLKGNGKKGTGTSVDASPTLRDDCFYEAIWKERACTSSGSRPCEGDWLILGDHKGLGRAVSERLSALGGRCTLVRAGEGTLRDVDFARSSESGRPQWRGVIHLWSLNFVRNDTATAEELTEAQRVCCGSVLQLAQTLGPVQRDETPRLWLVTRGAQPDHNTGTALSLAQAPLWGFARVIAMEHPALHCTCIDLDPSCQDNELEMLLAELRGGDGEDQVAFRGGRRHVARLAHVPVASLAPATIRFHDTGSYLITGGLTGLGLTVARWIAESGGGQVVLMGRRMPSVAAAEVIRQMEQSGTRVLVARGDVANEGDVRRVLDENDRSGRPLKGIVHCAGVIEDGLIVNQDWPRFERVLAPKIAGAWNIHRLTASRKLDFFVLFSSAASLVGSPGQSNYATANAFLDALAHYRQALGVPALSINWGAWGDVGVAVDRNLGDRLAARGITPLTPRDGLKALAELLGHASQIGVMVVDWSRALSQLPTTPYYADILAARGLVAGAPVPPPGEGLRQRLLSQPESQRLGLLSATVAAEVARVLGLDPARRIDWEQPLHEFGLDSLMAMELKNALERSVDHVLPATLLFDHPSVERLVEYLARDVLAVTSCGRGGDEHMASRSIDADGLEDLSEDQVAALLTGRLDELDRGDSR